MHAPGARLGLVNISNQSNHNAVRSRGNAPGIRLVTSAESGLGLGVTEFQQRIEPVVGVNRVVFKRRVKTPWIFAAMLTGFLLAVGSYTLYDDIFGNKDYELFTRNVVAWAAAFAVAWAGSRK